MALFSNSPAKLYIYLPTIREYGILLWILQFVSCERMPEILNIAFSGSGLNFLAHSFIM